MRFSRYHEQKATHRLTPAPTRSFAEQTRRLAEQLQQQHRQETHGHQYHILPVIEQINTCVDLLDHFFPGMQAAYLGDKLFEVTLSLDQVPHLVLQASAVPHRNWFHRLGAWRIIHCGLYTLRPHPDTPHQSVLFLSPFALEMTEQGYPVNLLERDSASHLYSVNRVTEYPVVEYIDPGPETYKIEETCHGYRLSDIEDHYGSLEAFAPQSHLSLIETHYGGLFHFENIPLLMEAAEQLAVVFERAYLPALTKGPRNQLRIGGQTYHRLHSSHPRASR